MRLPGCNPKHEQLYNMTADTVCVAYSRQETSLLTQLCVACSQSLPSRDIIADSIETVMCGQWYDGNISLPGCDKNMPGVVMAMARFNRPSIMVYGGSIKPGCSKIDGRNLAVSMTFESYGKQHMLCESCGSTCARVCCHHASGQWIT